MNAKPERLPALINSALSDEITFNVIRGVPGGTIAKPRELLVASTTFAMNYFAANASFSQLISMDFKEEADRKEHCSIRLELLMSRPIRVDSLIQNEFNVHVLSSK